MKRLLLIILLSVGFTNVSFAYEYGNAELCSLISNNNCDGLCVSADSELVTEARKRKLSCGGVTETLQYDVSSNDETCKNGFYKAYEPESSYPHDYFCEKLPLNTIALGTFSGYTCKPGYYNKFEFGVVCEKVPTNAVKKGNGWACKGGYKKTSSGNSCTRSSNGFDIWTNKEFCSRWWQAPGSHMFKAEEEQRGILCNLKDYMNTGKWGCYDGFKKSGDKCINKINKLVVPSYRN